MEEAAIMILKKFKHRHKQHHFFVTGALMITFEFNSFLTLDICNNRGIIV